MTNDNESPSSSASSFSSVSWHSRSEPSRSSAFSRTSRRTQNVLLSALTLVLLVTLVQLARLSQIPAYIEPDTPAYKEPDMVSHSRRLKLSPLHSVPLKNDVAAIPPVVRQNETVKLPTRPKRYAVVNFVDSKSYYLWGIYSMHRQMEKFDMLPSIKHIVLVATDLKPRYKKLLRGWLGDENVIEIDKNFVRDHVPGGVWSTVFSKIEFFNLTQFDKVIGLDNDILIRRNLAHWFDYPAPAATQARGSIEWNSGAMVLEPNKRTYETMLEYIPKTRTWDAKKNNGTDGFNSGHGHQGFLSSFYLSNVTNDTMFTMSYGASVLSSDLKRVKENGYFWRHRNEAIETVHFTLDKPWKGKTASNHPILCSVLNEWLESVADAPKDKLPELPDMMRKCPRKDVAEERETNQAAVEERETNEAAVEEREANEAATGTRDKHNAALGIPEDKKDAALGIPEEKRKKRRKKKSLRKEVEKLSPLSNPVASPTPDETRSEGDICFVTSIYGSSAESSNVPPNVSELQRVDFPSSKFYLFTNRNDLDSSGWIKVVRHFDYRRFVTQSRWPKFMAWREPFIQECRVVFYMDGNVSPKSRKNKSLLKLADSIIKSESGLAQNPVRRKETNTLMAELKHILQTKMDSLANVKETEEWLQDQDDFEEQNHATVYDNSVFGYDPKNPLFQAAATFFWDHYSMENDTWYDHPLWAYTLAKLGLIPIPIGLGEKRRAFFVQHRTNLASGGHRSNDNSAVNVAVA